MISPTGEVHPVAALFPMLPEDELEELAADIREHGLQHPIVLDTEGRLIDGRNRLEGCKRAKVKPKFVEFIGQDVVAYILSSNVTRRHMTTGQRGMAVAKSLLVSNTTQAEAARVNGVNRTRVGQAAMVIQWAPELADAVLGGATPLDYAYQTAHDRKRAAESATAQMERLQRTAPDLAQLVVEERMALTEALAAERDRDERNRQHRQVTTRLVAEALKLLDPGDADPDDLARRLDGATDIELPDKTKLTADRLEQASAVLLAWINYLPGRNGR